LQCQYETWTHVLVSKAWGFQLLVGFDNTGSPLLCTELLLVYWETIKTEAYLGRTPWLQI